MRIRVYKGALLAVLSTVLLQLASLGSAQQHLDAFIRINDFKDKAGDTAIYRFTVSYMGGALVRSTLPSSVVYTGDQNQPVQICRTYQISGETTPIADCTFNPQTNSVEFPVPENTPLGFLLFEIGNLRNPLYSQTLFGFTVQILDQNGANVLFQSQAEQVFVQIRPNIIYDQSLEVSSQQIAAESTFTFKFKITNPIPANGKVWLNFPVQNFEVPDQIESCLLSTYGSSWTSVQTSLTSSILQIYVGSEQIGGSGDAANLGQEIQIQVAGLTNPNTMEQTDSFTLETRNGAGQVIDRVTEGLATQVTQPAEISHQIFTVVSKVVGQMTITTFKLELPTTYQSGGYLIVKLPQSMSIDSQQLLCTLHIGFTEDQGMCDVPAVNQIRIYDTIKQKSLTFSLFNMKNPPNTQPTDSFEFLAYDPAGNVIANGPQDYVGFTPIPGLVKNPQVTREDSTVGALANSDSNMVTFAFFSSNVLQKDQWVQIRIPYSQFELVDPSLNPPQISCARKTSLNQDQQPEQTDCLVDTSSSSAHFLVSYKLNCPSVVDGGCPILTQITLQVSSGIKNIDWILPETQLQSIQMVTLTNNKLYKIDESTANILAAPDLVEGSLIDLNLQKEEGKVGETTKITFTFTTQNKIPLDGKIQLIFPSNSLQTPLQGSQLQCKNTETQEIHICQMQLNQADSELVQSVTIDDPCDGQICPQGKKLNLEVLGLRNPRSIKPIENLFQIRTQTSDNFQIDLGTLAQDKVSGLQLEPASLSQFQLIEPTNPDDSIVTGKVDSYKFAVTLSNGITPLLGKFELTIPGQISLVETQFSCAAYEETQMILLGCQKSAQNDKIVVQNQNLNSDFSGEKIIIMLQNSVINPASTKPTDFFQLHSFLQDAITGEYFLVEQDMDSIRVVANEPNQFDSVKVTRSDSTVSQPTELEVCFKPNNVIPVNSVLTIMVSSEQVIIQDVSSVLFTRNNQNLSLINYSGSSFTIIIPHWVPKGTEYCFLVQGVLLNPETTKPPSTSFSLEIQTSDSFKIDKSDSNIFIQPLLSAGPFLEAQASSDGINVAMPTTLTIEAKLKSSLPNGSTLQIQLPSQVFMEPQTGQVEHEIDGQNLGIVTQLITTNYLLGKYVSQITLNLPKPLNSGAGITVKIFNLRNRFDSVPLETSERITRLISIDNEGFTINSSEITVTIPSLISNQEGRILFSERTQLTIQRETEVKLDLQTSTPMLSNSILKVHLNKQQISQVQNKQIKCYLDQQSVFCASSESQTHIQLQMQVSCQGGICQEFNVFQLEIQGLENRVSVLPDEHLIESLYFQLFDTSGQYGIENSVSVPFDDILEPLQTQVNIETISASNYEVGQNSDWTFQIELDGRVEDQSLLSLQITPQIGVVDSGKLFYSQGTQFTKVSAEGNAMWNQVESDQNNFVTKVETRLRQKTNSISLQIQQVQNLFRAQPLNAAFKLEIKCKDGGLIAIGDTELIDASILVPSYITKAEVSRANKELDTETDIVVKIQFETVKVLPNSVLQVLIPLEMLQIRSNSGVCFFDTDPIFSCYVQIIDGFYVVTTLAKLEAELGKERKLTIRDVFKNPIQQTLYDSHISLKVANQGFDVLTSAPSLQLYITPPLTIDELALFEVYQDKMQAGQETQLNFVFELNHTVPKQSYVVIKIPNQTLLFDENAKLVCSVADIEIPCTQIEREQNYGEPQYVYSLEIRGFTESNRLLLEEAQTVQITVEGLKNVEMARPRFSDHFYEFFVVSSNGFVLAQDLIRDDEMPDFEAGLVKNVQVQRANDQIGFRYTVEYKVQFSPVTNLRQDTQAFISIPTIEATVDQGSLQCKNPNTLIRMNCSVVNQMSDESQVTVKVESICRKSSREIQLCLESELVQLSLQLKNSISLLGSLDPQSFGLQLMTPNEYLIAQQDENIFVEPPLKGIEFKDLQLERQINRVGSNEMLKLFTGSLDSSFFQNVDLKVRLPHNFAFLPDPENEGPLCQRVILDELIPFECDYETFFDEDQIESDSDEEEEDKQPIEMIRVKNICNPYHRCIGGEKFEVIFNVKNPTTNQRLFNDITMTVLLQQDGNLDIGIGSLEIDDLPKMLPNIASAIIRPSNAFNSSPECFKTGDLCSVGLDITTSNIVPSTQKRGYLNASLPQGFQIIGTKCEASLGLNYGVTCQITSDREITVRISEETYRQLEEENEDLNKIRVEISRVILPISTAKTQPVFIESFEQLFNAKGATKMFTLDSNQDEMENRVESLLKASLFKEIEVRRIDKQLAARTDLSIVIKLENEQILSIQDLVLVAKIPESAGFLDQSICQTKNGQTTFSRNCSKISQTEIKITNFNKFCDIKLKACNVNLLGFVNAEFAVDNPDPIIDSLSLQLNHVDFDETDAQIYQSDQNIFISPSLEPYSLKIDKAIMVPSQSETASEIGINIAIEADQKIMSNSFIFVKFLEEKYEPRPSITKQIEAKVNEKQANIVLIQGSADAISGILIEMEPINGDKAELSISGLMNPDFVSPKNEQMQVTIQIMGASQFSNQVMAEGTVLFETGLKPSKFSSLTIFSQKPFKDEITQFEVTFTMQPKLSETSTLEIDLPNDFRLHKTKLACSDLFDGTNMDCKRLTQSQIEISLPIKKLRSPLSLTSFGIQFGAVKNPDRVFEKEPIRLRVKDGQGHYLGEDKRSIFISEIQTDPEKCPEGCSVCSTSGVCIQCESPSETPLLQALGSECGSVCENGSFQVGARCVACSPECSLCQSLDMCTACGLSTENSQSTLSSMSDIESSDKLEIDQSSSSDDEEVFVDGRCLEECPLGTVLFENENTCVSDPNFSTDSQSEKDKRNSTNTFFEENLWERQNGECKVAGCSKCGFSSDFCTICTDGSIMMDGTCLLQCPTGSFKVENACYRCNPVCGSCAESANQCTSCHANLESELFGQDKYLPREQICVSECTPGTFWNEISEECVSCDQSCNTCSKEATTCTSCFSSRETGTDLYLYEDKCAEDCPVFAIQDENLHLCRSFVPTVQTFSQVPFVTMYASFGSFVAVVILSKIISGKKDFSLQVSISMASILEAIFKSALLISLWTTKRLIAFMLVSISLSLTSLVGIYFYETTFSVLLRKHAYRVSSKQAQFDEAEGKRSQKWKTVLKWASILCGLNITNLSGSHFCGIKVLQTNLRFESAYFLLPRMVKLEVVQLTLTTLWIFSGVLSILNFGFEESQAQIGAVAIILGGFVSLPLQVAQLKSDYSEIAKIEYEHVLVDAET